MTAAKTIEIEHGTNAGAQAHRKRLGEKPCDACREAARLYVAEWRARQPKKPKRVLVPCGTVSAYRRHQRWGEKPCEPCRRAQLAALAEYRSRAVTS